jgi:glycosyltransferase involved in cell wall biosynthesis
MTQMALISVVMPVFNGEKYILESVNSILAQTLKDIELIVIDDGSEDKTSEIVQSIHDERIIYRRLEKNQGTATATNIGHGLARGKYIAHMDADDIAVPDRLKWQASFLEKHPDVDILGGWMAFFGAVSDTVSRTPASDGEIKANFLSGIANIYNPTAMFRHSFIKAKQLKCDPALGGAFDFGFWVQAMFQGARFANLDRIVLRYRVHEEQQSKDLSRLRNELSRIRLSVLELFYPNLTVEERSAVEPLLQPASKINLTIAQINIGVEIIRKMLVFTVQSRVKENRKKLQEFLQSRINMIKKSLEMHFKQSALSNSNGH